MSLNDHLAGALRGNIGMLQMTLADFSDADLLVRPVPGANHANWQLGHLLVSEGSMMQAIGAKMPELPAGVAAKYTKETSKIDDAAAFLKKDELLALLAKSREAAAVFVQSATEAQLAAPGPENMRKFAPTVGDLVGLMSMHTTMHLGQFQVIRRKLGKPILF